jgi:hypothetical protein
MLRTIAAGVAFGCMSVQALILSSTPATSITINRCARSTDGKLVCTTCPTNGGSSDPATGPSPGALASLLAEGYQIIEVRVRGGGNVFLRKRYSYTPTFVCNLEPTGSPIDTAFKSCRYEGVPCSRAPDAYP